MKNQSSKSSCSNWRNNWVRWMTPLFWTKSWLRNPLWRKGPSLLDWGNSCSSTKVIWGSKRSAITNKRNSSDWRKGNFWRVLETSSDATNKNTQNWWLSWSLQKGTATRPTLDNAASKILPKALMNQISVTVLPVFCAIWRNVVLSMKRNLKDPQGTIPSKWQMMRPPAPMRRSWQPRSGISTFA